MLMVLHSILKKEVAKIINMDNVAIISTKGATVYVGRHYGMIEIFKRTYELSNFLPDLCYQIKILFKNFF